ncbi:protein kinase [Gimesia sp.]|uniref:protein kinase domain-containing protein n=1 Tax=Gimesia sp. TaxID=2024833 RepID=UPI0032EEEED0
MNEQEIFIAALEIEDLQQRAAYLDQVCGEDRQLREQVAALLNETEQSGEFLGVPVLEQMRRSSEATRVPGEDTGAQPGLDDLDIGFLQPATEAGSLGVLGHYDIQELIGRGGCGIVFKAFDQRLHRIVAIKVMTPAMAATSPARKRFLREARATAAIRHENVVNIYAVEEAPLPFLVMEYIDGKTLQQMIDDNGPLDLTTIVKYGRMIADGLEAAHLQGLIHRDIKPGNILIESGTGRVKITDFGLARAADDASRSQSGIIAGTPLYMSPEQVQGLKLDRKSDLFSLGSVLYVMCSGRPPFRAPSTLAVLKRVVDEEPRSIQEIIPEVPDWLVAIIRQLHEKDPDHRFQSAEDVAERLAGGAEAAVPMRQTRDESTSAKSKKLRQSRLSWMQAAAILIVLLSSFGFTEATGITRLHSTVIRYFSPEGTLVIEVEDPGVSVSIDGQELVIKGAGVEELRLKPGQYQFEATKDGEVLKRELVTVSRDGRKVIQIDQQPAPVASSSADKPSPEFTEESKPVDPDRRAAEYVLSTGGKVRLNDFSRHGEKKSFTTLSELPATPFRLTHVELTDNAQLDDSGLAAFQGTENLRSVVFSGSRNFTEVGLAHLSKNLELQWVDLWRTSINKTGLEQLSQFPDLRDVRLGETSLTADDLAVLKQFKSLKKIELIMLNHTGADDSTLAILSAAPQLIQLNLEDTNVTDAGLAHLEKNLKLQYLFLKGTKVTNVGVRKLSQALPWYNPRPEEPDKNKTVSKSMPSQADLSSEDPDRRAAEYVLFMGGQVWINKDSAFTDGNGIKTLDRLPTEPFRLTHAKLIDNARVTDSGMEAFRGTRNLRGIYLSNATHVGDKGILHLKENTHLHEIHLWGTQVTGAGLKAFENCDAIIDFYFGYTRVSDADMAFFRDCASWKSLRCIMVTGLGITDQGIAHLAGTPRLGQIHIERTKITDAGLLQLATCPKLGLVGAHETKITSQGVEKFLQARKGKCGILWEEPGMPPESEGTVVAKEPAPLSVDAGFSRVWRLTKLQPRKAEYGWDPGPRRVLVSPEFERCEEYLVIDQNSSITWEIPAGTKSISATGLYNFGSYVNFRVAFDGKEAFCSGVTRLQKILLDIPEGSSTMMLSVGRVTDNAEHIAACPVYWLKPRLYKEPLSATRTIPETEDFTKLSKLTPIAGKVKIAQDGSSPPKSEELTIEPPGYDSLPVCTEMLWAHANTSLSYEIPKGAKRFRAVAAAYRSRSVRFLVQIDGREVYRSPVAGILPVDVPIPEGAREITLLTDDCGDQRNDWADWCYPRFVGER